ncbi:hypothetical protein [uncultured Shewanella sp.]|uniref:hypothetical protein n=1 Tax=uncultured Shewanella sp. TaxID=173975 RepID=UPI0026259A5E|nr:hypothetical protein [uncultured Shewanella sp.]
MNIVGSALTAYYGGPEAAAWNYDFNRAMGASSNAALKSAGITYAVSAATYGASAIVNPYIQVLAQATIGGIAAEAQGGKFANGFISAGIGAAIGGGRGIQNPYYRVAVAAVVGGTTSTIMGGKFGNGAMTAAFSAALRAADNGEFGSGEVKAGNTTKTKVVPDKAGLRKALDSAVDRGELSRARGFDSADAAAKEVLTVTAPLSRKYGLEVGGSIFEGKNGKYHYTLPIIGDSNSVYVAPNWVGYHTHPSGALAFSNRFTAYEGGGNDALWVDNANKDLYLGVEYNDGTIGIAVCEYNSCPNIGQFGTEGRIIK